MVSRRGFNSAMLVALGALSSGAAIACVGQIQSGIGGARVATGALSGEHETHDAPAQAASGGAPSADLVLHDPVMPPALPGDIKKIAMDVNERVVEIAPGVKQEVWMFGDTVPGTTLHVREGDLIESTMVNKAKIAHSFDFHAAQTPPNVSFKDIPPGGSITYQWRANYPGLFTYHCVTPPMVMHLGSGMYGAIWVEPKQPLPPAREYVIVQGEFYGKDDPKGYRVSDMGKMLKTDPDYVVFNGYASRFVDKPLRAEPGELIRLFVLNPGPNLFSAFHVVGAVFDKVYVEGNPKNVLYGIQTHTIPPSGGAVFEMTIPEPGLYHFVNHAFTNANKGAIGIIQVGDVPVAGH